MADLIARVNESKPLWDIPCQEPKGAVSNFGVDVSCGTGVGPMCKTAVFENPSLPPMQAAESCTVPEKHPSTLQLSTGHWFSVRPTS